MKSKVICEYIVNQLKFGFHILCKNKLISDGKYEERQWEKIGYDT